MKHVINYTKHKVKLFVLCFLTVSKITIYSEYEANRLFAWGKENFKQAPQHSHDYIKRSKKFIRNIKVYNQLTTIATFDIMFLTDQVRKLFVDYHAKIQGLNFDEIEILYKRQENENKYFISAYVIAWHDEYVFLDSKSLFTGEHQKNHSLLKGDDPIWNVSLIVGGRKYLPETIKTVEMPVEYQKFFGSCCNQFATIYLVRFAAKDKLGNFIFTTEKSSPLLRFSSPIYKVDAIWKDINVYDHQG